MAFVRPEGGALFGVLGVDSNVAATVRQRCTPGPVRAGGGICSPATPLYKGRRSLRCVEKRDGPAYAVVFRDSFAHKSRWRPKTQIGMYVLNRLTEWRCLIWHRILLRPSLIIVDEPSDPNRLPEGTLIVPIDPAPSKG